MHIPFEKESAKKYGPGFALGFVALAFAAGYAWRAWSSRRPFVVPGSLSTVPDETGHYDMDGVSFDDKQGVIVGSDGFAPRVKAAEKGGKKGKTPRSTA